MLGYAGHNALQSAYRGHFATVLAHSERWGEFAKWLKCWAKLTDAADITVQILSQYGTFLAELVDDEEMEVAYAQNLLSSANVVLSALRGDDAIWVSPSSVVGRRTLVRETPPTSLDRAAVERVILILSEAGYFRVAHVIRLAREFGMRSREAALCDAAIGLNEASTLGKINVVAGTKGGRGRYVDRWVPLSSNGMDALREAARCQDSAKNLVPAGQNLFAFQTHVRHVALPVLRSEGLSTIHDLRAAYACERYEILTGFPAPCVDGRRRAPKDLDMTARQTISHELGHGRPQICGAYIGTSR